MGEFSDMDLNELKRRMSGNNVYDFRHVWQKKRRGLNLISLGFKMAKILSLVLPVF